LNAQCNLQYSFSGQISPAVARKVSNKAHHPVVSSNLNLFTKGVAEQLTML